MRMTGRQSMAHALSPADHRWRGHHGRDDRRGNSRDGSTTPFGEVWRASASQVVRLTDAFRWLHHWQSLGLRGRSHDEVLRVRVHGGRLEGLSIEARAQHPGIVLRLFTPSSVVYRRLSRHAETLAERLTLRLGCHVTVVLGDLDVARTGAAW